MTEGGKEAVREEREVEKNRSGQSDGESAQVNCKGKKAKYDVHGCFVG